MLRWFSIIVLAMGLASLEALAQPLGSYGPGETLYVPFLTHNATGEMVNTDVLPTAVLVRGSSVDTDVPVEVRHTSLALYTLVARIPNDATYRTQSTIGLVVTATVEGHAGGALLAYQRLEQRRRSVVGSSVGIPGDSEMLTSWLLTMIAGWIVAGITFINRAKYVKATISFILAVRDFAKEHETDLAAVAKLLEAVSQQSKAQGANEIIGSKVDALNARVMKPDGTAY